MNKRLLYLTILVIALFVIGIRIGSYSEQTKQSSIQANNIISALSYKAIANDGIEDTQAIQSAIDHISSDGGGIATFPKGVYLIDATKSIILKNNVTLKFNEGAILKVIPNSAAYYEVLRIHDVKKVSILGKLTIVGDRKEHIGQEGQWGFGISIRGSEEVIIKNVQIQDCWGDGIYIGSTEQQNYSKNITIENPVLKNNRRQGISIISAVNLKIIKPVITDTNGTSPESGIDIEPNQHTERIVNVNIINPNLFNNLGYGILIHLVNLNENSVPVSVTVDFSESPIKDEFRVDKPEKIKGQIKVLY